MQEISDDEVEKLFEILNSLIEKSELDKETKDKLKYLLDGFQKKRAANYPLILQNLIKMSMKK